MGNKIAQEIECEDSKFIERFFSDMLRHDRAIEKVKSEPNLNNDYKVIDLNRRFLDSAKELYQKINWSKYKITPSELNTTPTFKINFKSDFIIKLVMATAIIGIAAAIIIPILVSHF